jgi:hypothetical protein
MIEGAAFLHQLAQGKAGSSSGLAAASHIKKYWRGRSRKKLPLLS